MFYFLSTYCGLGFQFFSDELFTLSVAWKEEGETGLGTEMVK
jgi:hypothetical protein